MFVWLQVGEKLGRYDVEKRQAVENEDYDKAKLKKLQADEYRLQAYKDLELTEFLEVQGVRLFSWQNTSLNIYMSNTI